MRADDFIDIMGESDDDIIDVVTVDKNPPEDVRPLIKFKGFPCTICHKVLRDKASLTRHIKNMHTCKVPCSFCGKLLKTFGRSDSLRSHLASCISFSKLVRHHYKQDIEKDELKAIAWKFSLECSKKNRLPRNFGSLDVEQVNKVKAIHDTPVKDVVIYQLVTLLNRYRLKKEQVYNPSTVEGVKMVEARQSIKTIDAEIN